MTIPMKPEADALRIGMLAGLFNRAEAVTWADLLVAELDKPCGELIDLSTSDGMDASSFAALLSSIPGAADLGFTKQILLARLRAQLAKGAALTSVAAALAQLTKLISFTDDERSAIERLGAAGPSDSLRGEAEKLLAAYDLAGKTRLLE